MPFSGWRGGGRGQPSSPVTRARVQMQEKVETSRFILCRLAENSAMLSIHSPKPRRHCSRCHTEPSQNTSFPSSGLDLKNENPNHFERTFVTADDQLGLSSPVRQSQHKKLQEGGVEEEVLVVLREGREARDPLRPVANDLHGSGQEVVELPDVLGVVPLRTSRALLELQPANSHQPLGAAASQGLCGRCVRAYVGVVQAGRVGLHVRPDEGAEQSAATKTGVRRSFGFGRQTTSATFQAVRPHHCTQTPCFKNTPLL